MRPGVLCLLMMVLAVNSAVQAEETSDSGNVQALHLPSPASRIAELEQRLRESERLREEQLRLAQNAEAERESAQLARLRQENQRLKLQLKEAQSIASSRLLTEQQQWFIAGGGVAVIALVCGIFVGGRRKQRQQWLN
ncbi:translation initiation factor 2 [Pseudomonas cichorii]|nr:translation initiation factor 2 [Pseudomonas cichorii]MBX8489995.1 translation initiation factor 2 [Pseudomonas cichorii]MBX8533523.1 translation initiation factor 2 [Pseudomonas cichorii]MBX8538501.1 translation initiation factor 2 [Pseudomonas cichorii]MBX8543456.1 translation initiation factor 2 [Pseudomonas cichorii]MBX8559112.1 translation initiation factor 2 [Pseudomonas cichorii]